jgi:hypothetical protein
MSIQPAQDCKPSVEDDADIQECLVLLQAHSIRVIVFDMDQTAVAMHSRGSLQRKDLPDYLKQATRDFQRLVPQLHQHGFHLAIATHSDEAEFETDRRASEIDRETHIMGKELATKLVEYCFSSPIASSFFIVAYNPRVRGQNQDPLNCIKRHHMREIQQHFSVSGAEILFFDDTVEVVKDCASQFGVQALLVDPDKGFRLGDLVNALSPSPSSMTQ